MPGRQLSDVARGNGTTLDVPVISTTLTRRESRFASQRGPVAPTVAAERVSVTIATARVQAMIPRRPPKR